MFVESGPGNWSGKAEMRGVKTWEGERQRCSGLRHGGAGNQDGCSTLGFETGAEIVERADFFVGGDTSDDVAGEAAHEVGLCSFQFQSGDHIANDRCESSSIVKAKRCHLVASPTKIHSLFQRHQLGMSIVPEFLGLGMAIRSRLMKRVLGLAQGGVLQCDEIPSVGCQPGSVLKHRWRLGFALFDILKFFHPSTLQEAFACLAVDRFCCKAILYVQSIGQHSLKCRIV